MDGMEDEWKGKKKESNPLESKPYLIKHRSWPNDFLPFLFWPRDRHLHESRRDNQTIANIDPLARTVWRSSLSGDFYFLCRKKRRTVHRWGQVSLQAISPIPCYKKTLSIQCKDEVETLKKIRPTQPYFRWTTVLILSPLMAFISIGWKSMSIQSGSLKPLLKLLTVNCFWKRESLSNFLL